MSTVCFVLNTRIPLPTPVLRMIVSTERRVRSLHSRIVVRATTDTTDQRRQLIQFYSLTKHNLQTTHNPAGATARTAIRLTRATQSRCAEGREFEPRPGQYSRMSFSSDQVTGTVFPHLNMPFLPNSEFI